MEIKKNENEPDLLASKNLYIFKTQISYGITCLNYLCMVTSPNRKGVILVGGNLDRNHKIIQNQRCIQYKHISKMVLGNLDCRYSCPILILILHF